jgi:hypothetical protein
VLHGTGCILRNRSELPSFRFGISFARPKPQQNGSA